MFKGEGVRFDSGRAFWTPLLGAAFALPYPDLLCVRIHKQMRVRFHPRRRPGLSDRGPAKLAFQTCGSRTLPEAKEGADGNKEVGGKSVGPRCDVCSVIRGAAPESLTATRN
jgi:hypothetical protein